MATRPDDDARRARDADREATLAAVAKPGARVCKAFTVGIAEHDWVRGIVEQADTRGIRVRIEDPGRFPHVVEGRPLAKDVTISDAAASWVPCL